MSERATDTPTLRVIPVVRLAELPALAGELAARVRASGFSPEIVIYVETGARLLAHEVAAKFGVPVLPVWVRRGGHGLKKHLAPLAARLPVAARDWLRRAEEFSGIHRLTRRTAAMGETVSLQGKHVLLVDDASDTGRTIEVARDLVCAAGVARADLRTAVLAATTAAAHAAVDFHLFDRNCRMPWSADSDERTEAEARAARLAPAHAPRTF
jgi:hypoxanthine phosphoribosyltransferase